MIPGVPYDAEIEFLGINSGGWIDTEFGNFQTSNVKIFCRMQITKFNDAYCVYFGQFSLNDTTRALLIRRHNNTTNLQAYFNTGSGQYVNFSPSSSIISMFIDMGDFSVDNVILKHGFTSFYLDSPIYIGAVKINDEIRFDTSEFNLYQFKCIDSNGFLVRDFIPVRVGQVGYMYDRVSRKLFGNKGTGSFVLGPDVAKPVIGLYGMRKFYAPGELPKGYTKHSVLRVTGDAEYRSINTLIRPENSNDFSIFFNRVDLIGYSPTYACVGTIAENIKTPTGIGCFFVPPYRDVHITSGTNDSKYKTPDGFPVVNVSIEFGVKENKRYFKIVRLSDGGAIEYSWDISGNEHGTSQSSFLIGVKRSWWDNCTGTVLGRCRIISGDKLIWDGTPCSRDSDGVPGYWDSVSRRFCPGAKGFAVYDNPVWEDA